MLMFQDPMCPSLNHLHHLDLLNHLTKSVDSYNMFVNHLKLPTPIMEKLGGMMRLVIV